MITKHLFIVVGLLMLICSVGATTWSDGTGCWTAVATDTDIIVKWNATGTTTWTPPAGITSVEYLIIGGGAGGGSGYGSGAGGGGAGGFRNGTMGVAYGTVYTISVGAGGLGGDSATYNSGVDGSLSMFNTTQAAGGGGGGSYNNKPARAGGSGGGGSQAQSTGAAGNTPATVPSQGNNGGNYASNIGGGGGGASEVGKNAAAGVGGAGGNGTLNTITDESFYYSGGGGGAGTSTNVGGTGGLGGGANGGNTSVYTIDAVNKTGGGGGGAFDGYFRGGNGGSGVVVIRYEVPIPYPVPSFTSNVTTGYPPLSVQFNDTSITSPTGWNWSYTNVTPGNNTQIWWSTIQNATNTFGIGNWDIRLNVTNASGYSTTVNPYYINVSDSGGLSGWNRQDIMMDQVYTLTLNVKDASTLFGIPGATVLTSNGDNTTTNAFGVATISTNYTALVVQVGATGYGSRAVSYVVDRDRTETLYLTAIVAPVEGTPLTYYSPWQVRIRIADFNGNPLPGTNITANYVATTLPSTNVSWLINAFGINSAVAEQMVDSGTAMAGTTDSNGGLSFTMFKSIMYSLAITNTTAGISSTKTLYPSDQEYLIRVALPGQAAYNNTLSQMANTSLPVYQLNATAYNLSVIYRDTSGLTTNVQFQVKWRNGTFLHNQSLGNPGTGVVVGNYTILNPGIGKEVIWLFNATRSGT